MKVLFICTHNRCRSILAEALVRDANDPLLSAASAGSAPAGVVHPLTLKYLNDAGIDATGLSSKSLDDVQTFDPDIAVTLCDSAAGESCPLWLGKALRIHWGVADPSKTESGPEEERAAFETCIDALRQRVAVLRSLAGKALNRESLATALRDAGAVVTAA